MSECRVSISSMSDMSKDASVSGDKSPIPEGNVQRVCKEWIVREDQLYAYRLQNDEINNHYEGNRHKSRVVREDIPLAKSLQRNEEDDATVMRLAYEKILDQQHDADVRVARELQEQVHREMLIQKLMEEEDERYAKKLYDKEKERLAKKRLTRERIQVERVKALVSSEHTNPLNSNEDNDNGQIAHLAQSIDAVRMSESLPNASSPVSDDDIDLSDFCLQPPPGLSHDEVKQFLEEQDLELARFMQTQESKRKSNALRDKTTVIEAQDYEIARILQKQEKERIKRLKEKARQKALMKQQPRQQSTSSLEENTRVVSPPQVTLSDDESITYEEPYEMYHHNIAIDLDPTYKRHPHTQQSLPLPPKSLGLPQPKLSPSEQSLSRTDYYAPPLEEDANGIHFAQVYHVTPSSSTLESLESKPKRNDIIDDPCPVIPPHSGNSKINPAHYSPIHTLRNDASSMSPLAPYMPVQGQRRVSSTEKTKKKKDNCRTQ